MSENLTKHTAIPWSVRKCTMSNSTFLIESENDPRALVRWRDENPDLKQNSFSGTSIARIHGSINGSGKEFGPHKLIDDGEVEANAEFIVKAVNSHDELLAALEMVMIHIDPLACFNHWDRCRNAIAKAKGKDYVPENK